MTPPSQSVPLSLYQSEALRPYADRVIHGFTGKPQTFGGSACPRETILAHRRELCATTGMNIEKLLVPDQQHTANSRNNREEDFRETDSVILLDPGVPAMVLTADCVPVLLYDPTQHLGAVIHAGWRGSAARISAMTAQRLIEEIGSRPANLVAVIGPAITGPHYEVSDEVAEALQKTLPPSIPPEDYRSLNLRGRPQVDLKTVNRLQLESLGIRHIEILPFCTVTDNDRFWSHRRGETGRQAAYLQLL